MKKILYSLFAVFVFSGCLINVNAQVVNCDCTNCPVSITDNGNFNGNIFVQNTGPNILGVDNCLSSICFTVTHTWIGDLDFVLTAPDGTSYIIMGDMDNNAGGCGSSCDNLDVCITLGTGNPAGTGAIDYAVLGGGGSNCVSGNFTIATGVTNPNGPGAAAPSGNLNDFNNGTGTVSGMWTLTVGDNCAADVGFLTDWQMNFCDESGINCSSTPLCIMNSINANIGPCIPASGTYNVTGTVTYSNPPASGQLIISGCNGIQQVFNAPFGTSVNYSLTGLPANGLGCNVTATFTADPMCTIDIGGFTAPTCPCNMDYFSANIGLCDPATNTYEITGDIEFTSPPATGQLIVEDCNGNQQVFNPPFVSPLVYTLTNCIPNAAPCDVSVYFTADAACSQTLNFTAPTPCNCAADAGTYTANIIGISNNNYVLCWNDQIDINSNNDFTYPQNVSDPVIPYNPGIFYLMYSCPPTPGIDIVTDPCLQGIIGTTQDYNDLNDMAIINANPGVFTNNTIYYVPITMYDVTGNWYSVTDYGGLCFDLGPTFAVTYLPEITYTFTENCNTGQATFTISGGHPDVYGTNFTASNLLPATASFANTTCADGGTITINGLQDGQNYSFTITDANGCPITCSGGPYIAASDATITPAGPFCPGDPAIQMTAVDLGGTWSATCGGCITAGGLFTPAIAGAGTYTITYNIPGVCGDVATTSVTVNPLLVSTITPQAAVCVSNGPVNFAAATPGGTWSATCGACINSATGVFTPAISGAGTFTITYTLAGACGSFDTETFTVNPLPNAVANNNGPLCELQALNLTSAGGTDYDWVGPNAYVQNNTQNPSIPSVTVLNGGTYTVTVTNANGCSATATTSLVINTNIIFNAYNNGPLCNGAQLDLSADNIVGATYNWVGPNAYSQLNVQNPSIGSITLAGAGVYTVTATNAAGCTGTATTNVVVNALPVAAANSNSPVCDGFSLNLSANGGVDYDWTGPNAYIQNNSQNPVINPATVAATGTYTVTVTNASGCSSTATITATVNPLPNPIANNNGPLCELQTLNLTSAGGTDYDWVGPNAYVQNNTQNPSIPAVIVANGGTYTVTVTNANGCSATATTSLVINTNLIFNAYNNGPLCNGTQLDLSADNIVGATYDWVGPNAYSQLNVQNPSIGSITLAGAGVYTVTATNAAGCTGTATTNVVVNALPVAAANSNSPICDGLALNLGAIGGVDYDWTGPNAYIQNNSQNPVINPATVAATGIYTVIVTDASGCSSTATITATVNALPNAIANNNGPLCDGDNANLSSGGGIQYSWAGPGGYADPVSQNPVIIPANPAQSGVYTVTVTDASTCSSTATTTLLVNALPVINTNTNAPVCDGLTINLFANGAINYAWVGPSAFASGLQNPVILNSTAINNGVYTVTGTDGNGCSSTSTISITTFPNPIPAFTGNPLSGCAPLCVDITDQSNGNGGVINSWNWNVEGQPASANQNTTVCYNNAGIYDVTLTVTTTDGCSTTLSMPNYITVNPNPVASFIYTPQEIIETDPEVTFASTSTGASNWLWDFGDGSNSLLENPLHSYGDTGVYCITLLVSSNAGCMDTAIGCLYVKPDYSLFIPNTFTVNDDGLNEIWQIYGRGVKSLNARIFDRWGEELYYFDDINKGWPGTRQNGNICKQDVYVYRVEVVDGKGDPHLYIGNVNLIR